MGIGFIKTTGSTAVDQRVRHDRFLKTEKAPLSPCHIRPDLGLNPRLQTRGDQPARGRHFRPLGYPPPPPYAKMERMSVNIYMFCDS